MSEIEISNYKAIDKGALKAFFNVYVPKWGIEVFGMQLCEKGSQRWVNFPQKMVEENGEKKYYPHLRFKNKDHMNKFSEKVIEALKAHQAPRQEDVFDDSDCPF